MVLLGSVVDFRVSQGRIASRATIFIRPPNCRATPRRNQLDDRDQHHEAAGEQTLRAVSPMSGRICPISRSPAQYGLYVFPICVLFVFLVWRRSTAAGAAVLRVS